MKDQAWYDKIASECDNFITSAQDESVDESERNDAIKKYQPCADKINVDEQAKLDAQAEEDKNKKELTDAQEATTAVHDEIKAGDNHERFSEECGADFK